MFRLLESEYIHRRRGYNRTVMIKDNYDRQIDYMRISVTDRCNLRCRYCMPEDIDFIPHDDILRYEEMLRLVKIFAKQGIRKIKITGGEPLVRNGCVDFMKQLKAVEGIENVTITTNGVLLDKYLPELIEAGVDGINISLDSLDREKYAYITGRDEFDRVWNGIENAIAAGLKVKLNCVPLREYNADEIFPNRIFQKFEHRINHCKQEYGDKTQSGRIVHSAQA